MGKTEKAFYNSFVIYDEGVHWLQNLFKESKTARHVYEEDASSLSILQLK